ncbi:hypothetical protein EC844_1339 [Acinetobacter calcoaceticus]|uniref:Uncharacterized protein n=1 Tax=Acinetobacter calcoaceticus TaxID=471 RepID=A0A4R1XBP9_ACICA|nr:hypothetical protein EC844_1339 [Acinetobacter calcoaceticus]
MSFIIAIQLKDSLILAADHQKTTLDLADPQSVQQSHASKIHSWEQGLISGVGEALMLTGAVGLFNANPQKDLSALPSCLTLSRQLRVQALGFEHAQFNLTRLFCTQYTPTGAQLYQIDAALPYRLSPLKPDTLSVFIFEPNLDHIAQALQQLQAGLRAFSSFSSQQDWVQYYLRAIANIFYLQHQHDSSMSQSFDIVFQNADQCLSAYIENSSIQK